jgi:hypothetical protein
MKKFLIIIIILIIVGAAVFGLSAKKGEKPADVGDADGAEKIAALSLTERYTSDAYHFSFNRATSTTVEEIPLEEGQTFVAHDTTAGVEFQIHVSSFDSAEKNITKERLLADIPDLSIIEEQPVLIGEGGSGLAFFSEESSLRYRQVWFAHGDFLYQITAPEKSDAFLQNTLNTWQFR